MLRAAADLLVAGNPVDWATDLGPVIGREAFDNIHRHVARLKNTSKVLLTMTEYAPTAPEIIANSMHAHAFEVGSIAEVSADLFGPVLQVVRWLNNRTELDS